MTLKSIKNTAIGLIVLSTSTTVVMVQAAGVPGQLGNIFRQSCNRVLDSIRMDPIIAPGTNRLSSHAHTVAGASAFASDATSEVLRLSHCTSCAVTEDKSAYWYPSLYYQHENGSLQYIPADVTTYYEPRGNVYNNEFPKDFNMIAGNAMRRAFTGAEVEKAVEWLCLGANNPNNGAGQPLPQSCTGDIRGQLQFPVCWNGQPSDPHQSHVSYAFQGDGVTMAFDGGVCPPTHPHRLVKLFIEVLFKTGINNGAAYPFHKVASNPRFVLANGDTTGFGFHVDFMNGWTPGILQKIIDTCDYGSQFGFFNPSNCAFIKPIFQDGNTQGQCRDLLPSVNKYQEGSVSTLNGRGTYDTTPVMLPQLPGCNAIGGTPTVVPYCPSPIMNPGGYFPPPPPPAGSTTPPTPAPQTSTATKPTSTSSKTSSTTTSSIPPPPSTCSTIPKISTSITCRRTHTIRSAGHESCVTVGSSFGITAAQLTSWNTGLNCGCGALPLGAVLCVSVA
ncbi:hypothetical protein HDU76_006971 [Blyttiomyces sp. JEL0837]|nr:hypothetical protein HDU76_006971 [Blyttiomyces sp. JEL0837]